VPSTSARGAYRARTSERREPRITVWLTPAEWEKVSASAARAGMAPGAYAAQALLDAAEYRAVKLPELRRQMVVVLMDTAEQVSSIGANLREAVGQLKACGEPGPDLEPTARHCRRVVRLAEEAAALVRRRLS
jgi:hypothetical protein